MSLDKPFSLSYMVCLPDSSNSAILQPKMIATANAWEMKDDTSLLKQGGHLSGFEC